MKIIHTADWHLGKLVHQLHMTEDQEYMLQQLIELIKIENPDAIIIAGDLYDRAIPPKEAVDLLNRTLVTLIFDLNIPVLAISGNHDSPDRLNFGSQLFKRQQFYLQARLDEAWEPVILYDEHGPVYFHLIPYVEPADVRKAFDDDTIETHHDAMDAIIRNIEENKEPGERHVFVGHAFLAGGMESESEERLSMLGGTPYISAELFKEFTYVALGHLHQPQKVKENYIRYSGSLLKYSFSEANHKKGVTVVDINDTGETSIRPVPLQPKRDMRVLEGYLDDLLQSNDEQVEDYLHVKLLDEGQILDPMGKLRKKFPNVLSLERAGLVGKAHTEQLSNVRERKQMSHMELFESFYEEIKGTEMDKSRKDAVSSIIQELVEVERNQ